MARNRLIKKGFYDDPKVGSLQPAARLLFVALWINADDTGCGIADSRLLKAQAFPYDADITPEMVEGWLHSMADLVMILLYEVDGQRYFRVNNFLKHQVISHPSKFEYPKPTMATLPNDSGSTQGVLAEHFGSTPPQSKRVKSTSKKNENVERKGKTDQDGTASFVSSDDHDLTSKANSDRCTKTAKDYFEFARLDKKQLGKLTPEFREQIAGEFLLYRMRVHRNDEPCCCSAVKFLEGVMDRCERNEVKYPPGVLKVKKTLEREALAK